MTAGLLVDKVAALLILTASFTALPPQAPRAIPPAFPQGLFSLEPPSSMEGTARLADEIRADLIRARSV